MGGPPEQGCKWWIRYVFVPLMGGGGLIAIIVAVIAIVLPRVLDTTPSPTEAPATEPELALREYYRLVAEREYDVTWSKLTDHFKNDRGLTRDAYVNFWNTVDRVDIVRIQRDEVTATSAWLTADLLYYYDSGRTVNERQRFNLVWDSVNHQWMITHSEILES